MCLLDEAVQQVLLQRLAGHRSATPERGMNVVGYVLDLDTRHVAGDGPLRGAERVGLGGGRRLLDTAKASLKAAGFAAAALWVLETNLAARRFYERQGWTPDGAHKVDDRGDLVLLEFRYTTAL